MIPFEYITEIAVSAIFLFLSVGGFLGMMLQTEPKAKRTGGVTGTTSDGYYVKTSVEFIEGFGHCVIEGYTDVRIPLRNGAYTMIKNVWFVHSGKLVPAHPNVWQGTTYQHAMARKLEAYSPVFQQLKTPISSNDTINL